MQVLIDLADNISISYIALHMNTLRIQTGINNLGDNSAI